MATTTSTLIGTEQDAEKSPTTKTLSKEAHYWDSFYAQWDIAVPSQFCVMVATEAVKTQPVVEFGCGNGRDSIYLVRHGFRVFAGDLSQEAIKHNCEKESKVGETMNGTTKAEFCVCDAADSEHVIGLVRKARESVGSTNVTLYNRFFLHTLTDEQELLFLSAMSGATVRGDKLYMEFRCSLDAELDHLYKRHFRRYVQTDKLIELIKTLGFEVQYQVTGQGMAKYKTEDPFVSRIIAQRV